MRRKYIEEDLNVMNCINTCIKGNENPLNSTLTYGGNTTTIGYNHLFQFAKLNIDSFTCAIDMVDGKEKKIANKSKVSK